jgi:hypothetical protein
LCDRLFGRVHARAVASAHAFTGTFNIDGNAEFHPGLTLAGLGQTEFSFASTSVECTTDQLNKVTAEKAKVKGDGQLSCLASNGLVEVKGEVKGKAK